MSTKPTVYTTSHCGYLDDNTLPWRGSVYFLRNGIIRLRKTGACATSGRVMQAAHRVIRKLTATTN